MTYVTAMSVYNRQDGGEVDLLPLERFGDFLTPKEVASVIPRTSVDSVRRRIRSGRLPATKNFGGRWLVPRWAVEAELQEMVRLARPNATAEPSGSSTSTGSVAEQRELPEQESLPL